MAAVVIGIVLGSARADAQVDFSGILHLDREISGDLAKATFEPPAPHQASRAPGGFSGGFGGRSFGRANYGQDRPAAARGATRAGLRR